MKFPKLDIFNNQKIAELNIQLTSKTSQLQQENRKLASMLTNFNSVLEYYTGENTIGELDAPKELVILYESLRTRSWEFIIKNHMAALIANKRVNWTIGTGLLFNLKPELEPFLEYYKDKDEAEEKRDEFTKIVEYKFRNFAKTTLCDYSGKKNLHELAREIDYNSIGDGDVLLKMRVKNKLPNIQVITGQAVIDPYIIDTDSGEAPKAGNNLIDGVEFNNKGEGVAYHIEVYKINNPGNQSALIINTENNNETGTKRLKAKFQGTDINSAWLYKNSDLQKLGETRATPLFSALFESLKHLNDYSIANAKNAQLLSQIAVVLERTGKAGEEPTFNDASTSLDSMGMVAATDENCVSQADVEHSANKNTMKLKGNGLFLDLPMDVKAKILNPTAQTDQAEFIKSSYQTISSCVGMAHEFLISSYNSNYSASMGARSDTQHELDVRTEMIPANQFYRKICDMFLYTQTLSGEINCPPLLKAYMSDDKISVRAITNSTFEGTKLKPIDPLKFIKSLREQLPESIRNDVPLNTMESLINSASNGDVDSVFPQMEAEIEKIPDNFKIVEPEVVVPK